MRWFRAAEAACRLRRRFERCAFQNCSNFVFFHVQVRSRQGARADCTPNFRERAFAPLPASSLFLHQLALCLLREVLEFEPDPSRSEHRVLGAEIGSQFVDDVLVATWL